MEQTRNVDVEGLCRLIGDGKVKVGDSFVVLGSFGHPELVTTEIVYNIEKGWSADTIVKKIGRFGKPTKSNVSEIRYMHGSGEGPGYCSKMNGHPVGSKDYHSLLE